MDNATYFEKWSWILIIEEDLETTCATYMFNMVESIFINILWISEPLLSDSIIY